MMTNNFKQEKEKTEDLEKVIWIREKGTFKVPFDPPFSVQECKQLRGDIDEQHKIRMEAFEFKMQPIVINEEPSRKVKLINIQKIHFYFIFYILGKLQNTRC